MTTTLTILYGHPDDTEAFERYYAETHLPMVARTPLRLESAKVVADPAGGTPSFYRVATIAFDDMEEMNRLMGTPEVQEVAADVANFATGGVTMLVAETD